MRTRSILTLLGVLLVAGAAAVFWRMGTLPVAQPSQPSQAPVTVQTHTPATPTPTPLAVPATMKRSCAPWDGEAITISMHYQGGAFSGSLFGKGLDSFKAGQSVILNESIDSKDGTGQANFCENSICNTYAPGSITISIPYAIVGATNPVRGTITIEGKDIPIDANWDPTQALCG